MAETKRDKFIRIAEARTNKIIDMVQLLGNCANRTAYDYTDKDVADIFGAIEREVKLAKQKFTAVGDKQTKFRLER